MTFPRIFTFGYIILLPAIFCYAQVPPANFDESKVPNYVLTDPLLTKDGRKVDTPELWHEVRRPELLRLFASEMFGQPLALQRFRQTTRNKLGQHGRPAFNGLITTVNHLDTELVLEGKAVRHQIRLGVLPLGSADNTAHSINVLIYTPKTDDPAKQVPAFVGLNFRGNHTIAADPNIHLGTVWRTPQGGWDGRDNILVPQSATEEERGMRASRWSVEMIIERGYALVTAHYQDFEPDFDGGLRYGVRRFIYSENETPEPNDANAIATWAWGLSRILDVLVSGKELGLNIDPERVAVIGHSRLGKTALWAGAIDQRFAMVISNNSGSGGVALSRREFGETLLLTNTARPHWFAGNFKKHGRDVQSMPFDQHELIALIAPRPVYIASAVEDLWADPKGEFLSVLHADPVYRLLGTDGFAGVREMPELDKSVGGTIGYHIRTGRHDITEFDWEQFLDFADRHFK